MKWFLEDFVNFEKLNANTELKSTWWSRYMAFRNKHIAHNIKATYAVPQFNPEFKRIRNRRKKKYFSHLQKKEMGIKKNFAK